MKKTFDYISKDSAVNAKNVIEDIANAVGKASTNPEIYSPDKYKKIMTAITVHLKNHYRVSYKISKNTIIVLRVRHTGKKPKSY